MAYTSSVSYHTSNTNAFAKICTQMVAMGFTLHDDISSTQKVYSTNGESGSFHTHYVEVTQSSGSFYFECWLYWNSGTSTGTCRTYDQYNYITYDSGGNDTLYIAGDKNGFTVTFGSETCGMYVGFIPGRIDSTSTLLTAGATAGASVSLTVSDTTGFIVGELYNIIDANGGNGIQWGVTISSVTDSTHLVVNTLDFNLSSGAYIGRGGDYFGHTQSNGTSLFKPNVFRGTDGTTSPTISQTITWSTSLGATYGDPAGLFNKRVLFPIMIYETTGTNPGIIGYSDSSKNIAFGEAAVTDLYMLTTGAIESGTTTSATASTIVDSSKSWSTDEWADKFVVITDGTGVAQSREIASNTGTTLTLTNNWITTPTATGTFQIVDSVFRCFYADFLYKDTF